MRRYVGERPWLAAVLSWALATALITAAYAVWTASNGEPFRWDIVRDSSLFAAPLALFRAWRDSRKK